jgi:hypothetical protein
MPAFLIIEAVETLASTNNKNIFCVKALIFITIVAEPAKRGENSTE